MPGPAPNPNARRRNNRGDWRTLPARCARPAPKWPLPGKALRGQAELWRHLWALPQAELWHEQRAVRLVARYAQTVLFAESSFNPQVAAEARQLEDRLLLSPDRLLRARCLIVDEGPAKPNAAAEVVDLDDWRELYG